MSFKDFLERGTTSTKKTPKSFKSFLDANVTEVSPIEQRKSVFESKPTEPTKAETRQLVPTVTGTSISEQLKPFTTPEVIETAKQKREEDKIAEQQRKTNLKNAEERLSNLLAEAKIIEESPEPDFAKQNELTKQILETRNLITSNQPGFQSGVREAFGFQPTERFGAQTATTERAEAQEKAIEEARTQQGFGAGRVVGEIGKQAALYATIGAALKGTQLGTSLAAKLGGGAVGEFAANQVVDLLVDTVIQTPQEIVKGDSLKQIGMNRLLDLGMNLGIGFGGEFFKGLKKADSVEFEKAVKQLSPEDAATVRNALETKVEVPLSPSTAQFQQPTRNVIDDFQAWRSANFGGATGKLPEGDIKAVRDLYFENTGKFIPDTSLKPFTVEEAITKTGRNTLTDTRPRSFKDVLDEAQPVTREAIEEITPTVARQGEEVVEKSFLDELIGSPRESDIPTPRTDTSAAAFQETARQSDVTTKELKKQIKDLELDVTSNEARTDLAKQIVDDNFDTSLRMVKEGDQFGSGVESEIGRELVTRLQEQGRNAEAIEVIESLSRKFRRAGQDVQAASIWSRSTPEGMQKWAVNTLNDANVKVDDKLIKEVGDDMRFIDDMTPEELGRRVAEKIGVDNDFVVSNILSSNSYDQLKSLNTAITMGKVFDKIPIVKARKLSSIQAMSHLLNGRTFLRNIFGNTASITGEVVSRVPASIADRALSMFTGNRSVLATMPQWKKSLNEGFKEGKRSFFEIAAGASRAKQGKYDLLFGSSFSSKLGKGLEKTLGVSLQTPDEFFKGFTKADSLYNQVKARLGKQVDNMSFDEIVEKSTKEEIEQAIKEAQFATFQNDSGLADFMSKTKGLLNKVHVDSNRQFLKESGEFGLGDLVMKYTRVPGNIITRGFEYSPVGYRKIAPFLLNPSAIKELSPQAQRELALQLGRATTGSGLIWLGKQLNDLGIISGTEDSKDYDVNAFNRAEGLGDYKINLDALKRLASGEDPRVQEGDKLASYNWLQPMTIPIAVGARLSAENPGSTQEALSAVGNATWEESLDLPTLYIIKKMMYEGMSEESTPLDVLSVPVEEAIPGFVPSVVRQTAQTLDPVVRQTKGDDEILNKIIANLPIASKSLQPRIDPLGRVTTREEGIIPNLIDPATRTTAQLTEYGDQLREISDLTGKTSVFPDRKPPNNVTIQGKKVDLTPEEQQQWQITEGQFVDEQYTNILSELDITSQEQANQLVKALERIKKTGGEIAKREFIQNRGGRFE